MHIRIEAFRGLNSFDYDVRDNKVNSLYGVCGPGKKPLLEALASRPDAGNVTIGHEEEGSAVFANPSEPEYGRHLTKCCFKQTNSESIASSLAIQTN